MNFIKMPENIKKTKGISMVIEIKVVTDHTSSPSGKQRQKKFGLGRPTASLIASVMTPVMRTEYNRPANGKRKVK